MWRLGIGIAVALLAADARAEEFCLGEPAASARHDLITGSVKIGKLSLKTSSTEPDDRRVMTCGGGLSADGDQIAPWECFVQVWRGVRLDGGTTITLQLLFARDGDTWALANGSVTFRDGKRLPLPLKPCDPASPVAPTANEERI